MKVVSVPGGFGDVSVGALSYRRYIELLLDHSAYAQVRIVMFHRMRNWVEHEPEGSPYRVLIQEIARSLVTDSIVSLGRLLNGDIRHKDKDDVSLKMLNERMRCLVAEGALPQEPFAELTSRQLREIKECSTRKSLLWHRNKLHAHLTERYVEDPQAVHRDEPLNYGVVLALSDRVFRMCNEHGTVASGRPEVRVNFTALYDVHLEHLLADMTQATRSRWPDLVPAAPVE